MGRRWLVLPLLLLLAGAALAEPPGTALTPAQALQQRVDGLLGFLASDPQATPTRLRAYLDQAVAPFIDFEQMAAWVAGPLHRDLSAKQRRQFRQALREQMLRALAVGLNGYPVREVSYFPPRGDPAAGDVTVGLAVRGPNALPVRLDFRLMHGPEGWRVVDVSANGLSAVAFYRTMIRTWVDRFGWDGMLARLGFQ